MDVLFLQNIWFEFLGTMSLVSSVKNAGYTPGLAIGKDKILLDAVRNHRPRLVAFSCVTGIQSWALSLAEAIKSGIDPEIKIIMGGPHPTYFPEILEENSCLDFICIGEGEGALTDLLQADCDPLRAREIPNLHVRCNGEVIKNGVRPLLDDLDSLPDMDRELFYQNRILRENPVKRLITGRGCPYGCSFCFNHSCKQLYKGKGPYVRKRSVDNVLEEVGRIIEAYPVKTFRFEDDLFGVNKRWLLKFCEEYPRRFNVPFICSMRADAMDSIVVKALKEAGCFNIVMGVETGDERLRNDLLKKNITDDQLRHASGLLREAGINFCTTNIMGLPGETFSQALRTVTFNLELKPKFTWCSVFQPYPRTELGRYVVEKGLVDSLDVDDIEPNYHSGSLLKQTDIHRSVNLHKFFYVIFNHPWILPAARFFSRFPTNPLYTLIHRVSFLFIYSKRWNISLKRAVEEGIKTTGFTRKTRSREPGARSQ